MARRAIIFLTAETLKDVVLELDLRGCGRLHQTGLSPLEELAAHRCHTAPRAGKKDREITMCTASAKYTFDTHVTNAYRRRQISETHNKGNPSFLTIYALMPLADSNATSAQINLDRRQLHFNARSMDVHITKLRKHLKGDPSVGNHKHPRQRVQASSLLTLR